MEKWVSLKNRGYFIENEIYDITTPFVNVEFGFDIVEVYHNSKYIGKFNSRILENEQHDPFLIKLSEFRQNRINQILEI